MSYLGFVQLIKMIPMSELPKKDFVDKLIATTIVYICLLITACKEQNTEVQLDTIHHNLGLIPEDANEPTYLLNVGMPPNYEDSIDTTQSEEGRAIRNKIIESESEEEKLKSEINSAPERIRYSNLK